MAHAAFEMAVLDAVLRRDDTSLAAHLGAARDRVIATATAGFDDDVESFVAAGYRSVKVKVSPDRSLSRRPVPDNVSLQVDANGSFAAEPDRVRPLDELGLLAIEQPVAPDDLQGHALLTRELRTSVCLDESVASLDALDAAITMQAADGVAVKPARLGGIAAARARTDRCVEAGLAAKVGGLLETGIGRAAALAVAALPGFVWPRICRRPTGTGTKTSPSRSISTRTAASWCRQDRASVSPSARTSSAKRRCGAERIVP